MVLNSCLYLRRWGRSRSALFRWQMWPSSSRSSFGCGFLAQMKEGDRRSGANVSRHEADQRIAQPVSETTKEACGDQTQDHGPLVSLYRVRSEKGAQFSTFGFVSRGCSILCRSFSCRSHHRVTAHLVGSYIYVFISFRY